MASRVFPLWRWGWWGGGLAVLAGLLVGCLPLPATPAVPDPAQDLLATQVALALTQTALAPTLAPADTPAAPPAEPTPGPPTPAPPTPVPTLPPAPYDGPCTPDLTTSPVTPTPGDWASYRGHRFQGWVLDIDYGPRNGILITPDWGDREGFSVEVYEDADPAHLVFFLARQVCRADDRPYWEITDVLTVPRPARNQAVLMGPRVYHYERGFWEPARAEDTRAFMGAELDLICSTPLPRALVALVQTDPAALPPIYDLDTRVPVTVLQAWRMDLTTTQRFVPVEPVPTGCQSGYAFGP